MSASKDLELGDATTLRAEPTPGAGAAALPVVTVGRDAAGADFSLGETLGAGGMGHVVLAEQVALHRPVAAKFARRPAEDAPALVREAIVAGRLEHPNIVPVHLLAATPEGTPFFVMKRVEGSPWSDALAKGQPLVEALEVLVKVCDALAFAHSRRVLHRDVKPANVLLGAFGEVYLVDWGLAVSLVPDPYLPLASELPGGGTPAYLAPEMAARDGANISERTDVYLLGATLYELLTGRPPRAAGSVEEALEAARAGVVPPLDGNVPRELAGLCQRALSRSPTARPPSALAFKQELVEHLRHREALALYEQAQHRLVKLEQVIAQKRVGAEASHLGLTAHAAFSECRFGFEQVRRLWPEFDDARRGLQRALLLMAEHEVAHHDARAARILLAQLDAPPAALLEAIEQEEAEVSHRQARLATLEREAEDREIDRALGRKYWLALGFGALTFAAAVVVHALVETGRLVLTTGLGLAVFSVPLAWSTLAAVLFRRGGSVNAAQRRILNGFRGSALTSVAWWAAAWVANLPPLTALALAYLVVASNWLMGALLFHRRSAIIAATSGLAAVVALAFPRFAVLAGGASALVGFSTLAWTQAQRRRAQAAGSAAGR
jgi:serine/threonine-protein kinase